jgi:Ser/Thr protein kinase RdoA (MazF antagonist)
LIPQSQNISLRKILSRYATRYQAIDTAPCDLQYANGVHLASGGFSGARIWRIETAAGPCALRGTPVSAVDVRRLAGLHRLLAHVSAAGLTQVPVPVMALDGSTFFENEGEVWQLEPWMPGAADYWQNPSAARLKAAMICLARWHLAAARFQPRETERLWFFCEPSGKSPGLAERAREIFRRNGTECGNLRRHLATSAWTEFADLGNKILDHFVRLAPRVETQLKLGLDAVVPLQPCLRDVWHDHVLFTGSEVTGLIDPHAARSDCVACDLARLLGSLAGDDRAGWDAGVAAYQSVRPLALGELALVELFDQTAVLLGGMTWLDWHCLEGRTFDDRERVLVRLRTIVGRMEVLARK